MDTDLSVGQTQRALHGQKFDCVAEGLGDRIMREFAPTVSGEITHPRLNFRM